jgi:hypothetical protein
MVVTNTPLRISDASMKKKVFVNSRIARSVIEARTENLRDEESAEAANSTSAVVLT